MNHIKLKVMAGILLVFFTGAAVGALATHIYTKHRFEKMVRGPAAFLFPRFMEKIGGALALTPEQREKTAEILGELEEALFEFRRQHTGELDAIIEQHFQAIRELLTPEQQEKLEDFKNNLHRLRKRWHRPHEKFGPPRGAEARRFQRMLKDRLDLSEDAWAEIRPIIQKDFRRKRRLFRRHWREDLPESDLRARLKAIEAETEATLARHLTPDQMAVFRELRDAFDAPPPPDAPGEVGRPIYEDRHRLALLPGEGP